MNDLPTPAHGITPEQEEFLMKPIRSTRIAKRSQGGKQLSYLESWDVRAHLIRLFGFGNFDAEVIDSELMFVREYENNGTKYEIAYKVTFRLVIRNPNGEEIARYTECAVGSASGGTGIGDLHDNALKTAASDALKRCAINLGSQFGLSLYDNGSTNEVIKHLVTTTGGWTKANDIKPEQAAALERSVGVTSPEPQAGIPVSTPDDVEKAVEVAKEKLGATVVEETPVPEPKMFDPESVEHHADDNDPLDTRTKLAKAMYAGIKDSDWTEEDRIPNINAVIGRTITTTKEMTKRDARVVLARLDWEQVKS